MSLPKDLKPEDVTLEKALKLLEVDGAVQREGTKFSRTANRWTPDLMRSEQVTQQRRNELAQIKSYVEHTGCLMEFPEVDRAEFFPIARARQKIKATQWPLLKWLAEVLGKAA